MTLIKHGLKVSGLSLLAVFGFMAITAAGASATSGLFLILNAAKTVSFDLHAQVTASIDLLIVFDVPAINLEIDCLALTVPEGLILTGGVAHLTLLFGQCKVYGTSPSLVQIAGCEVYPTAADRTAGTNKGHITIELLLFVLLHTGAAGSKTILNGLPKVGGGLFTKLFFKNCPSGGSADLAGGLTLLSHTTGHQVKHLFQEATGSFKLKQPTYGLNNMNLLGSIWLELTGTHAGLEWGII